jgi:hypothetical protein
LKQEDQESYQDRFRPPGIVRVKEVKVAPKQEDLAATLGSTIGKTNRENPTGSSSLSQNREDVILKSQFVTKADEKKLSNTYNDDQKERDAKQAKIDNAIWKTLPASQLWVRIQQPSKLEIEAGQRRLQKLNETAKKENEAKHNKSNK